MTRTRDPSLHERPLLETAVHGYNIHLQKAFKNDGIIPRASGSPGIWVAFLFPLAVIVGCLRTLDLTVAYISGAIYSANILLNVSYLIFHIHQYESLNVTKRINLLHGVVVSVTIFMYSKILNMDFKRSFCYAIANGLIYFEGVPFFLKVFPNSFTFGEVNVLVQGLSLFVFTVLLILNEVLLSGGPKNETENCSIILLLTLSWVLIFCIGPYLFKKLRVPKFFYLWSLFIASIIYMSISYILNCDCLMWFWLFLTKPERIGILSLWLVCSALAIFIVQHHIKVKKKSNTAIRKIFHGLIVIVYLSGILTDITLLYLSSGIVFGLFMVLEVLRILMIPPLHTFLDSAFSIYCDEKDSGKLALTPICLLVGHSIPVWLNSSKENPKEIYLALLSGVLSVGIGDTFASIGGKVIGKWKYKNSIKTVEGTICCALSQLISLQVLTFFNLVEISFPMFLRSIIGICITSVVEAKTDQIDNLVLPLVMYIVLML